MITSIMDRSNIIRTNISASKLVSLLIFILCGILFLPKLCLCVEYHLDDPREECIDEERKALLQFKDGVTMDLTGMLSDWVGEDFCAWRGVSCDNATGHVIKLCILPNLGRYVFDPNHLPEGLAGKALNPVPIPSATVDADCLPAIGNLTRLRQLDLHYLFLSGTVQSLHWLSRLASLKYLNLEGFELTQVAHYLLQTLNNLPSLQEVHLSHCGLSNLLPISSSFHLVNLSTSLLVLDLSYNYLNSTWPYWLLDLNSLIHLYLGYNDLHGQLPSNLGNKTLGNMGNLCNLQILDLSFNNFIGEITAFVDSLSRCSNSRIETLDLAYNQLTGNLLMSLGLMKRLKYLSLGYNSIQGSIPESLGQLSMLTVLDFSENYFKGVITEAHLLNLSRLKELMISQKSPNTSSLTFNISSDWIPPFKLEYLYIKSCHLGPKFPNWLKSQSELSIVVLSHTGISDTMPDWFWKLDLQFEVLNVSYNKITGRVPNSLKLNSYSSVDLGTNQFYGPLPLFSSNVDELILSHNQFSGSIPPHIGEVMPSLRHFHISHNSFHGSIPLSFGNVNGLVSLVISNNNFSGQIPSIWRNISSSLQILDMSNNHLSGTIPKTMGSLQYLRLLILSNNKLFGEFPSFLRNCSELFGLDIGDNKFFGELPAWIGESMPALSILSVGKNFFTGNIPSRLCGLSNLHVLDLSNNDLLGHIPHCIGNLSGMKSDTQGMLQYNYSLPGARFYTFSLPNARLDTESFTIMGNGRELNYTYDIGYVVNSLDLSDNKLSGKIPLALTSLVKLRILNLSNNHLTGKIPADIGNMKSLETLDISMNTLVGAIPLGMTFLTFLSHLNLSHNNLSGRIPTTNQFQTFEDSVYEGNVGLCGQPLQNNCSDNGQNSTQDDKEVKYGDVGNDFEKLGFFISLALGFIVGFWGVFGTLIIKKSWRNAYFGFAERVNDKCFLWFHRTFAAWWKSTRE